ncbi:MAG: hypothetical protein DMG39_30165 [Acidobacteria bacterium]|nr:MAG: hypothetical protein DMG39_30165 [Acidobacteriota bacterium]
MNLSLYALGRSQPIGLDRFASRRTGMSLRPETRSILLERQPTLLFEPGTRWAYSNSGYVVLGQIIEKVAGERYRDFMHHEIFQPLGMTNSEVSDETRELPNQAASYSKDDVGYRNIDYTPGSLIYGEGNISSTFEDMYRWDQALYGDKLVKQSTLAQALTPGKPANEILTDYGFWLADSPLARDTVLRAWESLARIQNFHSKVSAPSPDRCNSLQSRASRYKCLAGKNC